MKLAYLRISKDEKIVPIQIEAIEAEGFDKLYQDTDPLEIDKYNLLSDVKTGDTVVIWHISNLASSLSECFSILTHLVSIKADIKILSSNIYTGRSSGIFIYQMINFINEFKEILSSNKIRSMNDKRTKLGSKAGRRFKFTPQKELEVVKEYQKQSFTSRQLASRFNISIPTLYNILKRHQVSVYRL